MSPESLSQNASPAFIKAHRANAILHATDYSPLIRAIRLARDVPFGDGSAYTDNYEAHPAIKLLSEWWNSQAPAEYRKAKTFMVYARPEAEETELYSCSYDEIPDMRIDRFHNKESNAVFGSYVIVNFCEGKEDCREDANGCAELRSVSGELIESVGLSKEEYHYSWYTLVGLKDFPVNFPDAWDQLASVETLSSKLHLSPEIASSLSHEVETQNAIFISGLAGTGRTTLLNALIHLLPADNYVYTINFMSDAEVPDVMLIGDVSDNQKLLSSNTPEMIAALRGGADIIAINEAQFTDRQTLINYIGTGTSIWATIHANSIIQAISILSQALPEEYDTAPFGLSIIHLQMAANERISSVEIYHYGETPEQVRKYTNEG